MSFSKWFHKFIDDIPVKKRSPELLRSIYQQTVMQTFQGEDGSCYAHLSARLFVQNIFKLKDEEHLKENWTYRSTCRKILNTYNPPPITPELKDCGKYGYLKISMFLYLYYLITEKFGVDGGSIFQGATVRSDILAKKRPRHFTPEYNSMYTTVSRFINSKKLPPFYVNHVFLSNKPLDHEEHNGLVQLILLFLKHRLYIGCRLYADNDQSMGHLFMITGYSASKRAFYVKNTWGIFVSMLSVDDIGKSKITFDREKMTARVNMFAFVYTRKGDPFIFDTVTPNVITQFKHEFGDTEKTYSQNPFRKTKRIRV
jgi:hypothetical protein